MGRLCPQDGQIRAVRRQLSFKSFRPGGLSCSLLRTGCCTLTFAPHHTFPSNTETQNDLKVLIPSAQENLCPTPHQATSRRPDKSVLLSQIRLPQSNFCVLEAQEASGLTHGETEAQCSHSDVLLSEKRTGWLKPPADVL